MIYQTKQLIGRPVYTKGGIFIGRVRGIYIDGDSFLVSSIAVGGRWFRSALVISPKQIIEITKEKIVVADSVVMVGEAEINTA